MVCAAARLRIADALEDGAMTVENLAQTCGADTLSLHRLLRALASIGIVTESAPGTFGLTTLGDSLRRNAQDSAWPTVICWADLLADNWSHLTDCVRTGEKATQVMERAGITSRWAKDPDAGAVFRAVMGTGPAEHYGAIADSLDLANCRTVADLGGGGGSLLIAILSKAPKLAGMLVDRQASIEAAVPRFEREGLSSRCRLIPADLLEAVPPGADVCILKHVLHGYDDMQAIRILRNCNDSMPENGRILILEFVLPAKVDQVDSELEKRLMSDLNMMAVTGGRERTEGEWTSLIEQAGLQLVQRRPVPGDLASVIEAVRRDSL